MTEEFFRQGDMEKGRGLEVPMPFPSPDSESTSDLLELDVGETAASAAVTVVALLRRVGPP